MYCSDFQPNIDREEVLDYVQSNIDWFSDRIGGFNQPKTTKKLIGILDKYNRIRIARDNGIDNDATKFYSDLEAFIKNEL